MEAAEVREQKLVSRSREFPVPAGVRGLQVEQEEVDESRDSFEARPGRVATRVEAGVEAFGPRAREEGLREGRLRERLAAGKRHAAAARLVERRVAHDLRHDLVDGDLGPNEFESARRARPGARAADLAKRPVEDVRAVAHRVRAPWAGVHTPAAAHALARIEGERGTRGYALRVMAPPALERAAFQEYGGAYAGAVVDREPLDVENDAADAARAQALGIVCCRSGEGVHGPGTGPRARPLAAHSEPRSPPALRWPRARSSR